jgi:hypothetical protein|tara:strand:- start:5 stop:268 length:264 start_codon:yes stop_codon:yes gene_type:complete
MPIKKPRNYRKEYDNYQGTDVQKKNRAKRNAARRLLEKEGKLKKGDGKVANHKNPLSKGGGNGRDNLSVREAKANASYPRTSKGAMK